MIELMPSITGARALIVWCFGFPPALGFRTLVFSVLVFGAVGRMPPIEIGVSISSADANVAGLDSSSGSSLEICRSSPEGNVCPCCGKWFSPWSPLSIGSGWFEPLVISKRQLNLETNRCLKVVKDEKHHPHASIKREDVIPQSVSWGRGENCERNLSVAQTQCGDPVPVRGTSGGRPGRLGDVWGTPGDVWGTCGGRRGTCGGMLHVMPSHSSFRAFDRENPTWGV